MVSQSFREKLKTASAPFTTEELNIMDDDEAVAWLERYSDDPWLFHPLHDLNGHPKFLSKREHPVNSDPYMWFRDTEITYVALRVLLAANDTVTFFHPLCFHLCQQVIEKGNKSILALQCQQNKKLFNPMTYLHNLKKAIDDIDTSLLQARKISILCDVSKAFESGDIVGKYATITGGGMGVGMDWMRPIDCHMKIVYDLFQSKFVTRKTSFINQIKNGTAFSVGSLVQYGIPSRNIKLALLCKNPVFFPDWQNDCKKLMSD